MSPVRTINADGFSLIEVLVALLIVAMSMTAAYKAIASSSSNQHHLKARTLASWVAENEMAKLQLGILKPTIGATSGQQRMAGQTWRWERHISVAADSTLRRVSLSVSADDKLNPSATLVAFITATKK